MKSPHWWRQWRRGSQRVSTDEDSDRVHATSETGPDMTEIRGHCMATEEDLDEAIQYIHCVRGGGRDTGIDRVNELRMRTSRPPLTSDEREAIRNATEQRDQLAEKLRGDSAFENPLESILENPILIPEYMASEEHKKHQREAGQEPMPDRKAIVDVLAPSSSLSFPAPSACPLSAL